MANIGVASWRSRGLKAGITNAYSWNRITGSASSSAKYADTVTV